MSLIGEDFRTSSPRVVEGSRNPLLQLVGFTLSMLILRPGQHRRSSLRLQGYDYTFPGAYYVTIAIYRREKIFGVVVHGDVLLNDYGMIAKETWEWLPEQYPYVKIGEFIVMPDHFHGILQIIDFRRGGHSATCIWWLATRPYGATHHSSLLHP
jgi:hypothetical protein